MRIVARARIVLFLGCSYCTMQREYGYGSARGLREPRRYVPAGARQRSEAKRMGRQQHQGRLEKDLRIRIGPSRRPQQRAAFEETFRGEHAPWSMRLDGFKASSPPRVPKRGAKWRKYPLTRHDNPLPCLSAPEECIVRAHWHGRCSSPSRSNGGSAGTSPCCRRWPCGPMVSWRRRTAPVRSMNVLYVTKRKITPL